MDVVNRLHVSFVCHVGSDCFRLASDLLLTDKSEAVLHTN